MRKVAGICFCLMTVLAGCGGGGGGGGSSTVGGGGDGGAPGTSGGTINGYLSVSPATKSIGQTSRLRVGARPASGAQQPVVNATVTVTDISRSTKTNSDGRFTFTNVVAGTHTLAITHPQYRDPLTLSVTVTAGQVTTVDSDLGIGYYVLVGAGAYANLPPENSLQGPPNDCRNMANILLHAFYGNGVQLIDSAATKSRIKAAIIDATSRMTDKDFLVFFFSGHGASIQQPGNWYDLIAPTDVRLDDLSTFISDTELRDWLTTAPDPKRCIVILDSCFAGSFFDGTPSTKRLFAYALPLTATPRALQAVGCTVLSASAYNEYSWEINGQGVFTKYLVSGLSSSKTKADTDKDRVITAQELFDYASVQTSNEAPTQHPQIQVGINPTLLRY